MRTSEIRYYLHNLDEIKRQIKQGLEDIELYKLLEISTIHINVITDMPRYSTMVSTVEKIAISRADHIARLQNEVATKIMIVRCIDNVLGCLKGSIRDTIYMRYIDKAQGQRAMRFYEIAKNLGYDEQVVKKYDYLVVVNIKNRYEDMITKKSTD